jgi:PAS domain-containing protein
MSRVAIVGGWNLDLPTNKLTWTEETCRIHEVDPHYQPQLEDAISFYSPDARPVIKEAVERARTQGVSFDLELPFITAKGNHLWVRAIGTADRVDGQTVGLHGVFQDVTERKRAEEALRESEARLDFALENSLIGAWEMDLNSHITYRTPTNDRVYGYETMLPEWT